jgi:hypothetical protein
MRGPILVLVVGEIYRKALDFGRTSAQLSTCGCAVGASARATAANLNKSKSHTLGYSIDSLGQTVPHPPMKHKDTTSFFVSGQRLYL